MRSFFYAGLAFTLSLSACDSDMMDLTELPSEPTDPGPGPDVKPEPQPEPELGMVFTISNEADKNEVLAYVRAEDGSLSVMGTYPTGGLGRGAGLGSQSALALSDDHAYLFAVNAGSNEVSSFQIFPDHLALVDITSSRGDLPTSLTVRKNRLYVLNAAGSGSVSGFALEKGRMVPIADAIKPLSSTTETTSPAQVALSPDGKLLAVTERATNNLVTYVVNGDGTLGDPVVTLGNGITPFGFEFSPKGEIITSETGGGAGLSAVSAYDPNASGALSLVSGSVPSGQSAACWLVIAGDGRFAYTANTQTNNISGYNIGSNGVVSLFGDNGITAAMPDGSGPLDMAVSSDGKYLYTLLGRMDTVVGYRISSDGSLTALDGSVPASASSNGLAAF